MLASGLRCNRMWGGLKAFSGSQHFYSAPLVVKSFCMLCLSLCLCQSLFAPSPSLPLGWSWLASQKFPLKFSMFRCLVDAAHRVIMVTLTLACGSLGLLSHRSSHPSIGDGFKTTKTNKEREPHLSNVFQFGLSRRLLICEQNTVPRRPLFVLNPPYKNQVKQVFVSAEHNLALSNVFHKTA